MEYIDSLDNNFIKKIRKLKSKKHRDNYGLFIGEGIKFIDFQIVPFAVIVNKDSTFDVKYQLKLNSLTAKIIYVSSKVFFSISTQENSQGIVFVYNYLKNSRDNLGNNIVILDNISDPGNLGTIIRLMDAVGYKDILITKDSASMYNEKTVRSSMGSILNTNILYLSHEEILDILKKENYKIFATNLKKNSIDYRKMQLFSKNAFIFGNEGNGVSKVFLDNSHQDVIIPIYGAAQSLNVSVAAAIILYKSRELTELL